MLDSVTSFEIVKVHSFIKGGGRQAGKARRKDTRGTPFSVFQVSCEVMASLLRCVPKLPARHHSPVILKIDTR